jgi:protein-S-isoprenylcysteine O-methyltransferase Ste14
MKLYLFLTYLSWAVFCAVWTIGALDTKHEVRRRRTDSWQAFLARFALVAAAAFVIVRLGRRDAQHGHGVTPVDAGPALAWLSASCTMAGVGLAVWARVHLGRNWSSRPSAKEGHELVTSGPYRRLRHPIYTGMIGAFIGGALTGGVVGLTVLVTGTAIFVRRIAREEQIMDDLFPEQYPAYRRSTKRLIPFVW